MKQRLIVAIEAVAIVAAVMHWAADSRWRSTASQVACHGNSSERLMQLTSMLPAD